MRLPTVLLAGALALVPSIALADHPHPDRAARRQQIVERFDADRDGQLTGDERMRAKRAIKAMKRQHRQARRAARRQARFDRLLERFDVDRDGIVSPAEAGDRLQHLRHLDRNGDGWLTRDELAGARHRERRDVRREPRQRD